MSSEYFTRTSLYLVRLEIFEWIKLLRRQLHQFQENGAGRDFITASRANSRLITNSDVIHLGISDHSLVFLSRKTQYCRIGPRVIETRQFKHFNRGKFLSDLNQLPWANVDLYSDPMKCGMYGKKCFLAASINTHHLNPNEFGKNDLHGLLESY